MATLESLAGRRPLHAIRSICTSTAFCDISDHVDLVAFRGLRISGISTQMPHAAAIEATVMVHYAGRRLVCALRLDRRSRWLCSSLRVLGLAGN